MGAFLPADSIQIGAGDALSATTMPSVPAILSGRGMSERPKYGQAMTKTVLLARLFVQELSIGAGAKHMKRLGAGAFVREKRVARNLRESG